jgi:hypothetical protein
MTSFSLSKLSAVAVLAGGLALMPALARADDPPPPDPAVDVPADPAVDVVPDTPTDYDPVIAQSGIPVRGTEPNERTLGGGSSGDGLSASASDGHHGADEVWASPSKHGVRRSLFGTNSPLRDWMKKN